MITKNSSLKILIIALTVLLALTGCATEKFSSQTDGMTANLLLTPETPTTMDETTIAVSLTDGEQPVSGAEVFFYLSRPGLELTLPVSEVEETEPGRYEITTMLSETGVWNLAVDATYNATIYEFSFQFEVE